MADKTKKPLGASDEGAPFFTPAPKDTIVLRPIKETGADFDALEAEIIRVFKKMVYYPALKAALGVGRVSNAKKTPLQEAIESGRVSFKRGHFSGKFSAAVTKELKSIGAVWDKRSGTFSILQRVLPHDIRMAVMVHDQRVLDAYERVDRSLGKILPAKIAEHVKSEKFFDKTLWQLDKNIQDTLKNISVAPTLTPKRRKKIASEWRDNLDLYITDFAKKQIPELRKQVQKHAFSGGRYEELAKLIESSYGVTTRKARFLARQETSLLMAKYKETRYLEAGIEEYIWGCVAGSKNHPVRKAHKALLGSVQKWTDPPVTTEHGQPQRRNNPGQDYNCRCFARPIVRREQTDANKKR